MASISLSKRILVEELQSWANRGAGYNYLFDFDCFVSPSRSVVQNTNPSVSDSSYLYLKEICDNSIHEYALGTLRPSRGIPFQWPSLEQLAVYQASPKGLQLSSSASSSSSSSSYSPIPSFTLSSREERLKLLETLDFDPYEWTIEFPNSTKEDNEQIEDPREILLLLLCFDMFESLGLIEEFSIPRDSLQHFLSSVCYSYRSVPFHNFFHAYNVAQSLYYFLTVCEAKQKLQPLEILAVLVAALCHDIDHPGLNNSFQCNAHTKLSRLYNDFSVLEQYHCRCAFQLLDSPECNIFVNLSNSQKDLVRKCIVACILSTDLVSHGDYLSQIRKFDVASFSKLSSFDDRKLVLCCLIKCADISNEIRPTHIGKRWCSRVITEFFAQSALEKELGLPVADLMDPQKTKVSRGQIGFITFLCLPLFEEMLRLFPLMQKCYDQMKINKEKWLEEETAEQQQSSSSPSKSDQSTA